MHPEIFSFLQNGILIPFYSGVDFMPTCSVQIPDSGCSRILLRFSACSSGNNETFMRLFSDVGFISRGSTAVVAQCDLLYGFLMGKMVT